MGTIRNEMTIVHHWDKDKIKEIREDAIKVFDEVTGDKIANLMISPIMESYINREYTFIINGECSKVGWDASKLFHKARMKWVEKYKDDAANIIVINFGEGEASCYIVFDNRAEGKEYFIPSEEVEDEDNKQSKK